MLRWKSVLSSKLSPGHDVTIHGFLGQEVLLPCNCTNVNLTRGFRWQNGNKIVFQYESKSSKREVDRITTFVKDDRNNCSILLANITAEDQGSYRCCFFTQDEDAYERFFLSLKISAKFDVCQKKLSDQRFQCDVEGLYEGAEILWHLDGRPLTNSSTVKIINNSTKDAQLHRFKSELRSNSNITSNLTCSVRTGNMPLNITAHCKEPERRTNPPEQRNDRKYFLTIPFFLVLILLAAIAFKYSRSMARTVMKACLYTLHIWWDKVPAGQLSPQPSADLRSWHTG
ncbi:uncharacterized protein si:dkey-192g7.3 isoform X2 [Cheilinus undulatus]|uniref:uncharacterized protein si:dkey-192g7.3 isoform X2 n=1 Tax=Cheilinus undulatus TaxID=241271 RepID=UPI001BD206BC|nr:uncharacterized protein si:dkey-192g7.3 isoform X2 [Cheilinus undulatus]